MASLPSTNSIVDYLNSTGKDSSFSSRRSLYNDLGLSSRLGDYTGSSNQNLTLLENVRTGSTQSPSFFQGAAPPNAQEGEKLYGGASSFLASSPVLKPFNDALGSTANTTPSTAPRSKNFNLNEIIGKFSDPNAGQSQIPQTNRTAQDIIDSTINEVGTGTQQYTIKSGDTLGDIAKRFGSTVEEIAKANNIADPNKIRAGETLTIGQQNKSLNTSQPSASQARQQGGQPSNTPAITNPETPSGKRDAQTQQNYGISASTILGQYTPPNEADLVNEYLNSAEGKLMMEKLELDNQSALAKAEATKEALEQKHASEKESLNNKLASKGLAFSGIRGTQVKALADSLASSMLGVDRDLATKLLDADIRFRETVLEGVADLIDAAQSDQKDAIAQLNKAGWAVVGDQLVPTLARENASIDDIRADANLAISQRRLELAEQANARAASKASGGSDDPDWAVLTALLADSPDATDNEILQWALQYTDLNKTEIDSVLKSRPDTAWVESNAIDLVEKSFEKQFFGTRSGSELADAKEKARKKASTLKYNSQEEKQLLLDFIDTITVDDLDI